MNGSTSLLSSASTSPSASQLESTGASSPDAPQNNSYAFLIHSQDTLPRNLPPEVDNKPLARQKRRRTSPEDQAVLEAEYQRNPKPDKAARLEIVQRVALGEKEVQIWFQNRRQNFRRKAKPLLPHELPPPCPSTQQHSTSVMDIATITSSVDERALDAWDEPYRAPDRMGVMLQQGRAQPSTPSMIANNLITSARSAMSFHASQGSQTSVSISPSEVDTSFETAPTELNSSQYPSNGYTSNWEDSRFGKPSPRDLSLLAYGPPASRDGTLTNSQSGLTPLLGPRRSSSSLRLCLSLDGKAQVVEADDDPFVWSQPTTRDHPPSLRIRGLQRSHSAILSSEEFRPPSTGLTPPRAKIPVAGRMLGPREWEIFCDGSTVDGQASSGFAHRGASSVDVQNARSGRRRPLPPFKSVIPSRRESSSKRASKMPKLGRATSSLARLQTAGVGDRSKSKQPSTSTQLQSPSGDSDKENYAPDDEEPPQGQPHNLLSHRGARAVLGESGATTATMSRETATTNPMKRAGKALTGHSRRQRTRDQSGGKKQADATTTAGTDDDEPSIVEEEEEDLNCVQTLLSLSQGSWR